MKISMREAVKHFDVSRPTLLKALKSGTVSGVKDGQGQWQIDPAEMARAYRPRASGGKAFGPLPGKLATFSTPSDASEIAALRADLAKAEQRAAVAEARADAAGALADERGRALDDLRRLLPPPRRSWWRLFG